MLRVVRLLIKQLVVGYCDSSMREKDGPPEAQRINNAIPRHNVHDVLHGVNDHSLDASMRRRNGNSIVNKRKALAQHRIIKCAVNVTHELCKMLVLIVKAHGKRAAIVTANTNAK